MLTNRLISESDSHRQRTGTCVISPPSIVVYRAVPPAVSSEANFSLGGSRACQSTALDCHQYWHYWTAGHYWTAARIASSSSFRNDGGASSGVGASRRPIFQRMPARIAAFGGSRPADSISYPTASQMAARSSFVNAGEPSRSNRPTFSLIALRRSPTVCVTSSRTHTWIVFVPVRNTQFVGRLRIDENGCACLVQSSNWIGLGCAILHALVGSPRKLSGMA